MISSTARKYGSHGIPSNNVHRDVTGLAAMCGAQERVVGRDETHFHGKRHREAALLDDSVDGTHCFRSAHTRKRVFHLSEAHSPGHCEDPIRTIDARALSSQPSNRPIDGWDPRGQSSSEPARDPEEVIGQQHVVGPRAGSGPGTEWLVDAIVRSGMDQPASTQSDPPIS
jgi:hypothetical protein